MTYNAKDVILSARLDSSFLGVPIGGIASMIAVIHEWLQSKLSGMLESNDVMRYIILSSCGAVIQFIVVLT